MLYCYGSINIHKFRGSKHKICKQNKGLKRIYSYIYNSCYAFLISAMFLSFFSNELSFESKSKASFVLLSVFIVTLSLFLAYMLSFSNLNIYMLYIIIVSFSSLLLLLIKITKEKIKI
jgi:hypothetical protein